MNIGIFFGSMTGNTENVAELISTIVKDSCSLDYITNLTQDDIDKYDLLIFGIPTWNIGELESSWAWRSG